MSSNVSPMSTVIAKLLRRAAQTVSRHARAQKRLLELWESLPNELKATILQMACYFRRNVKLELEIGNAGTPNAAYPSYTFHILAPLPAALSINFRTRQRALKVYQLGLKEQTRKIYWSSETDFAELTLHEIRKSLPLVKAMPEIRFLAISGLRWKILKYYEDIVGRENIDTFRHSLRRFNCLERVILIEPTIITGFGNHKYDASEDAHAESFRARLGEDVTEAPFDSNIPACVVIADAVSKFLEKMLTQSMETKIANEKLHRQKLESWNMAVSENEFKCSDWWKAPRIEVMTRQEYQALFE